MSSRPPGSSSDEGHPDDSDVTREVPRRVRSEAPPTPAPDCQSPWSGGYQGPPTQASGQPPAAYLPPAAPAGPVFPPSYGPPSAPEPRFAGQQSAAGQPPSDYALPGGLSGRPWHSPDAGFPLPTGGGWPTPPPPGGQRRRSRAILVMLLIVAVVATVTTVLLTTPDSKTTAGPSQPAPAPSGAPGPTAAPFPSPAPSTPPGPLPSIGLVPTPPGLAAIGYHAYSVGLVAPADIALGPAEILQFRRHHLEQVVGLRALTFGRSDAFGDDYDADINILRFHDAAGAKAELAYSNTVNEETSQVIALPGLPDATAFVNKDTSSNGVGVGAFTTVGRYQVVVIVNGLSSNQPTNATVVAAEAARVLRAVLPDAADIQPPPSSGGGSAIPTLPAPRPSGTRA